MPDATSSLRDALLDRELRLSLMAGRVGVVGSVATPVFLGSPDMSIVAVLIGRLGRDDVDEFLLQLGHAGTSVSKSDVTMRWSARTGRLQYSHPGHSERFIVGEVTPALEAALDLARAWEEALVRAAERVIVMRVP